MAGRLDDTTHAAAIARVGELLKYAVELREHLELITRSPAFKGSPRSQDFLRYVVEKALKGDFDDLRERTIGIELFQRAANYDTAEDAIVRVTASDVRKRLLQYYGKCEPQPRFRIDLPSGSYLPAFRDVGVPVEAVAAAPAVPVKSAGLRSLLHRPLSFTLGAALGMAVLLIAAGVVLRSVFPSRFASPSPAPNLLSTALQNTPGPVQVVVGDDGLLLIHVLLGRDFTLQEYENLKYLSTPAIAEKLGLQRFWASLSTRQITNVGNLQNATRIVENLHARNWNISIRHPRQVNARDFGTGNVVILGSSHANPWAGLFTVPDSNYAFESTAPGTSATIRNLKPSSGEPATFEVRQDPRTAKTVSYARVSFIDNHTRTGRVVLIAGQSTSATEWAGEFLLRPDSLPRVFENCGMASTAPLPNFEMIVRVTEVNEIGDSAELVSCRKVPARR